MPVTRRMIKINLAHLFREQPLRQSTIREHGSTEAFSCPTPQALLLNYLLQLLECEVELSTMLQNTTVRVSTELATEFFDATCATGTALLIKLLQLKEAVTFFTMLLD